MEDVMLTTIDNPYNPHHQFDDWFAFDSQKGYHSCSYLARIAATSDSLSEEENNEIIDNAIQSIIDFDPLGIYIRIRPNDKVIPVSIQRGEGS